MNIYATPASFLPSPIYGRGAGGEGVIANSALSPTLSTRRAPNKWERGAKRVQP